MPLEFGESYADDAADVPVWLIAIKRRLGMPETYSENKKHLIKNAGQ